ncbi:hypothetical protein CC78DRAFT_534540 [Lojkania enalia]|uniref:Uncharacterized protein n=1 Tax=Lojkania enalia TaxID=147567 RepID=A0A9P4K7N9_9PLEO|nr:hypothetical protein CC78DRAFT_534540 [Didymosphaeria enalia]
MKTVYSLLTLASVALVATAPAPFVKPGPVVTDATRDIVIPNTNFGRREAAMVEDLSKRALKLDAVLTKAKAKQAEAEDNAQAMEQAQAEAEQQAAEEAAALKEAQAQAEAEAAQAEAEKQAQEHAAAMEEAQQQAEAEAEAEAEKQAQEYAQAMEEAQKQAEEQAAAEAEAQKQAEEQAAAEQQAAEAAQAGNATEVAMPPALNETAAANATDIVIEDGAAVNETADANEEAALAAEEQKKEQGNSIQDLLDNLLGGGNGKGGLDLGNLLGRRQQKRTRRVRRNLNARDAATLMDAAAVAA